MKQEKIKFLHKDFTAIGKSFLQNQKKSRNIFLHTSVKISENFHIKHLWWTKTDLSKETKKKILRKDTLQISEAVIQVCFLKKVSLKVSSATKLFFAIK